MPITRERGGVATTTAPSAPTTTTRSRGRTPAAATTRTTRAKKEPVEQDDGLADELERVLKISQPKVPVAVKRTTATVKAHSGTVGKSGPNGAVPPVRPARGVKKVTSTAELVKGNKADEAGKIARPATAVTAVKAVATAPLKAVQPATVRRQAPMPIQPEAGPSRQPALLPKPTSAPCKPDAVASSSRIKHTESEPPAYATDTSITPAQRARLANTALQTSQAALGLAIRAGYRIGRKVKVGEGEWGDERVEEITWEMESALNVLGGMDERGELGNKGLVVDKGIGLLVQRCIGMAHYTKAMEFMVSSRPRMIRLYSAQEVPERQDQNQDGSKKEIPEAWRTVLSLPPSTTDVSQLDEGIRFLLFQSQLSAWICLLALRSRYPTPLSKSLPLPATSSNTSVHPMSLALHLPRSTTSPLIKYFLQLISSFTTSSTDYPHAIRLTACYTSITVSAAPTSAGISSQTPSQIWDDLHKKAFDGLQAGCDIKDMAACLSDVVEWVEAMVDQRKEDKAAWFGGKDWTALMDMWIGMGRKLNDVEMIHQALSRMTASTSIRSTASSSPSDEAGPSTPRSSTPPGQLQRPVPIRSGSSRRAVRKVDDAESSVTHLCGELSALAVIFDKYLDSPDDMSAAAVQSALTSFDVLALSDSVLCLNDSDTGREAFDKVSRNVERIRRRCAGLLKDKIDRGSLNGINDAARRWLIGAVDLVDDCVHGSQMDLTQVSIPLNSLISGSLQTLLDLFQNSTSGPSPHSTSAPVAFLDRMHLLILLSRPLLPLIELVDYVRCLAGNASSYTLTLYNNGKYADALVYARIAADRSTEVMEYLKEKFAGSEDGKEQEEVHASKKYGLVRDGMPRKWETVAQCALKVGDHRTHFESMAKVLTWTPLPLLSQLQTLSAEVPYPQIWLSHPDLQNTLYRLSQPLLSHPISETSYTDLILSSPLQLRGQEGDLVKALLVEKWMEALERGMMVPQVREGMLKAGDWVLGVYKAGKWPVRRLRVICRILGIMLQTDDSVERSSELLDEMAVLTKMKDLGRDEKLSESIAEYRATSLLLRALFSHRQAEDPTMAVSAVAVEAMAELRQIILPPTRTKTDRSDPSAKSLAPPTIGHVKQPLGRAATTLAPSSRTATNSKSRTVSEKTPKRVSVKEARKVSDTASSSSATPTVEFIDLPRLTSLLTSLISLLGLLALPLQKIEALKLARALMRNKPDFSAEYTILSSRLGTEYAKLGKWGRATAVFTQARKVSCGEEGKIECGLRWGAVLAQMGRVEDAKKEYEAAYALYTGLQPGKPTGWTGRTMERVGKYERAALARVTLANIAAVEGKSAVALTHLGAAYRLYTRYVEGAASLGPQVSPVDKAASTAKTVVEEDDPFSIPSKGRSGNTATTGTGADQPAKDAVSRNHIAVDVLQNKVLSGLQWHATETLLASMFDLGAAYAVRGTARDAEYFLDQAGKVATVVRASLVLARSEAQLGQLEGRMRKYESSTGRLELANGLYVNVEGPDAVQGRIIQGDLLEKRQAAQEALQVFERGGKDIEGLEAGFGKNEALMPTPEKPAIKKTSISSPGRDQLLPSTMAHVLRQRIWLGRQGGADEEEKGELVKQIQALEHSSADKAEELFLTGRLALMEVLRMFKTDLFMSSLTDSTIAMPMSSLTRHTQNRHSTRRTVNTLLARSSAAFQSAIELMEQDGKVEDVRQAGLSLALLHAFQTSLGEGGVDLATAAADMLASMSCITIGREMITAIESKFIDGPLDDLTWPAPGPISPSLISEDLSGAEVNLRSTWNSISARLQSPSISSPVDLSPLPLSWAVISISVAEDHSTIFLSRHQRDHPPVVLCLPLDRQGKREGEDNPLPFTDALEELREITDTSDAQARNAKYIDTREGKAEWWTTRHELDKRMGELLSGMEQNWLGAFKSILKPQTSVTPDKISKLRTKLEKIFVEALAGIGTDMRKIKAVKLDDAVLACFATLDGTTTEDELEDLVYFMLDLYGFHGIPVAISELDIDQIGVDIKQALIEIDVRHPSNLIPDQQPEHLLLILDKNVQSFPWESIPVLRGRPISRTPSLPFLLDHLRLSRLTSPETDGRLSVNARKVFYILNPSGDLTRTQTHFEPWIEQMKERAGWKGIVGRAPTDLEMVAALKENDLVLFFGHGGAEQYVRSRHVQHLPRCATTFLWGCSSGLLKDQGDLDKTGTAWNYMMAGCLIANLWDVTDRDIDRLSTEVHKKLGLDAARLGPITKGTKGAILPLSDLSTSQALNASRDECRMKYLTGAAPVVYGLPVWMF